MKQVLSLMFLVIILCGCSKETNLYVPTNEVTNEENNKEVLSYAEKTLGITIDKNHDWVLSRKYQVTVKADAPMEDIRLVCILSNDPYLSSAQLLASASASNDAEITVEYRAPLAQQLLHAACVNDKGEMQTVAFVPGDGKVSFTKERTVTIERNKVVRRAKRSADEETVVVDDDLLYIPWNRPDYPELQQEALLFVPKKFPEGQTSNRPQVEALNNHSLQTDWIGGQVTMTYLGGRMDNTTTHIGYRIYPIDDPENVQTYIINDRYDASSDDPLKNYMVDEGKRPTNYSSQKVALVWRDHTGNLKNALPPDMKIDFFVVVDGKDMSSDSLRVTVYSVNGRTYLSCEDSNNDTFNDKMFYIEEGIIAAPVAPDVKPAPLTPLFWTYAWEDSELGDFDMNDCVIRVCENADDASKLDITLLAVGAKRDLKVYFAANDVDVFGGELHDVLGIARGQMTNTNQKDVNPVTVTVAKPAGFDFQTNAFKLQTKRFENEMAGYENEYTFVMLPTKGQDPHAIVIPGNWAWPKERVAITQAYPKFSQWAKDVTDMNAQDWYLYPAEKKVMSIE